MIPDAGFERERHVVLEEIRRSQDNARRRVFHHVSQLAFERLPYRRQVLGPAPVVEQLTAQQMRDFHNHWYHPAAMTAVAVGDLPVDQLIRIVEDSVTQAHSPASAAQRSVACTAPADSPPLHPPEVPFTRIRRCEVTDATLQQARLIMTWRVPGLTDLADTYALDVLASVLAQGRTARLVKDLREERGLVSGISASNTNYLHQGVFSISAQLPVAHIAAVEAEIAQHIRDLQAGAVTAAELARVCTRVAKNFIFGNETPSDRTGLYGYYQALLGDLTPALLYPEVIQSLTLEDLQIAAQRFLCADAYGIVVVKPDAEEAEG
jgi:zinc protease